MLILYQTKNRTQTETVLLENEAFDTDVDVKAYCDKAQELYEKFCDCYTTEQVTAVIDYQLSRMQANKISVREIVMSYAVLGEMLLNRAETVWAGNILMAQYMLEVVKLVAKRRIFNAKSIGANEIVTASVALEKIYLVGADGKA